MGQYAVGQWDCRIFLNQLYLQKKIDEKSWFFACWYKLIEIKSWLKNIGVDFVINGCVHSGRKAQWCVDINSDI